MSARTVLSEADIQAALDCLESGWLTMGPRIQGLEADFAAQLGVAHAVAVGSGTSALHLACLAAGVGVGDEVVVAALAGPGAVTAPRAAGGLPVRADVGDPLAPELTPDAVAAVAGPATRAVIASHLAGTPTDAPALRALCDARGWVLVEDATDALGAVLPGGAPAGSAGHLGCFSFASRRVVGVGEGGMVVSDDEALAARVRSLRSHAMTSVTWDRHRGHAESYDVVDLGFNARMDEPRAALAVSRLARLAELVGERRALVDAARSTVAGRDDVFVAGAQAAAAGAAPQAVVLLAAGAAGRAILADDLARAGLPVGAWPDAWAGLDGLADAPRAEAARERSVLLDLGALVGAGLDPEGLRAALEGLSRR